METATTTKIMEALNKCGVYYLATVQGDQPRVRPLGFVMEYGGRPAFCTSNEKPMYRQMLANPKVEISGFDGEKTVRVSGRAVFVTSPEAQAKALEVMPDLKNIYAVGDGRFEIFVLEDIAAVCTTMAGEAVPL